MMHALIAACSLICLLAYFRACCFLTLLVLCHSCANISSSWLTPSHITNNGGFPHFYLFFILVAAVLCVFRVLLIIKCWCRSLNLQLNLWGRGLVTVLIKNTPCINSLDGSFESLLFTWVWSNPSVLLDPRWKALIEIQISIVASNGTLNWKESKSLNKKSYFCMIFSEENNTVCQRLHP